MDRNRDARSKHERRLKKARDSKSPYQSSTSVTSRRNPSSASKNISKRLNTSSSGVKIKTNHRMLNLLSHHTPKFNNPKPESPFDLSKEWLEESKSLLIQFHSGNKHAKRLANFRSSGSKVNKSLAFPFI